MYTDKWDDVLCEIAFGKSYFTQLGEVVGEDIVDAVLNEMEKEGLIYFVEVKVALTEKGLKRIQGTLSSMLGEKNNVK